MGPARGLRGEAAAGAAGAERCVSGVLWGRGLWAAGSGRLCVRGVSTGEFGWLWMRGVPTAAFGGLCVAELGVAGLGDRSGAGGSGTRHHHLGVCLGKCLMKRFGGSCLGLQVWVGELSGEGLEGQVWGCFSTRCGQRKRP